MLVGILISMLDNGTNPTSQNKSDIEVDKRHESLYKDIITRRKNMMTDKIILTDADGVLLDWEVAFEEWMEQHGYEKKVSAIYDISTTYGIEKTEGKRLVKEFNESAWMGFLPAFRDARSGVARLVEAGYKFIVITSLSLDKKAKMLRESNLKNVFGRDMFVEVICLDTGADKDDALVKYDGQDLWWVEDKPENAECGLQFGLKPILIEHPHNEYHDHEYIDYVMGWNEIADIILLDEFDLEQR